MLTRRLVDADRLFESIYDNVSAPYEDFVAAKEECLREIEDAPTVDAVPVVQARWIEDRSGIIICPECKRGYNLHAKYTHYCPHCGAKMNGGNENV